MLAGLTARAGIGVGGLEKAVSALEKAHAEGGTSYRFAVLEGKIYAQVERGSDDAQTGRIGKDGEIQGGSRWRTLAELAS